MKIYKVKAGADGSAGKGIKSTAVTYQAGTSGTSAPTGTWSTSVPSVSANQYLWTRTIITYTDNSTSTSYSVGKMGATGAKGDAAVVYSILPSVTDIKKSMTGQLSTSTVTCAKYKTVGNNKPVITTEKTLKYQRIGVDSSEIAYTGAVTVTSATTSIVFVLYDGTTELDRENVLVLSDASDLEIGGTNLLINSASLN